MQTSLVRRFTRVLYRIAFRLRQVHLFVRRPLTLGARVLVINDGCVLLVRMTYTRDWYLPGGAVDAGETTKTAALRELKEECAMQASDATLFGVYLNSRHGNSDHVVLYVAEGVREIPGAKPDHEIEEMRFFPVDHLPENTSPATRQRIAEFLEGAPKSEHW